MHGIIDSLAIALLLAAGAWLIRSVARQFKAAPPRPWGTILTRAMLALVTFAIAAYLLIALLDGNS
jgi:hypothetical protein